MARKNVKTEYWAKAPKEFIASEINGKMDDYLRWLSESGQADKMQKSYNLCYGEGHEGRGRYGVEQEGDDAVVSRLTVPHYKNLLDRIHSMVCQAKLSFKPKAINSDSKSQLTADFAKGLLEYETDRGLSKVTSRAVANSLNLFDAYIYAPWNRNAGEQVRPDTSGRILMSGKQEYYVLNAFECARAWEQEESPWYICETKQNKWELAAAFPEHKDAIISADSSRESEYTYLATSYANSGELNDEDVVRVRTLLHKPTAALRTGRITMIVGETVIEDRGFDYEELPVVRMKAGEVLASTVADSPASSLISLQEVLDRVYSAKVTNVLNGCISNIYTRDPNLDIEAIGKGKNLITANEPPIALALTGNSPDTDALINDLINQETLLSGVNNTARGNPETSLKSGTSLSLMLATAIQFVSTIQAQYAQATADLATIIVHNLQLFCTEQRLAYIAGSAGRMQVRAFTGSDLEGIDRISVELGNPITQNVAGRMELVQLLLQYQAIKDPRKIDDFLRTGNWESLTESNFQESILIREENEMLRRGEMPPVIMSDIHPAHIIEHLTVLYSMDARTNPVIIRATLDHVQAHLNEQKAMNPDLAAILGIPPLPSQQQPPPGAQPAPGGPETAPDGSGDQTPEVMGTNLPNPPEGTPEAFQSPYAQFQQSIATNPASQEANPGEPV
jgi:hypothetical protein